MVPMLSPSDQSIDYISNLPEALICFILSFLPTKSAVKTSLLSSRWKYVWTKVPALDFTGMPHPLRSESDLSDDDDEDDNLSAIRFNFVDNVLKQNDASFLRCFRFNFSFKDDLLDIISWLNSVKKREICELDLNLGSATATYLPKEFLLCKRLTVLNLDGFTIEAIPESLHLPNLETIHFIHIMFPNDQFLKRLVLGCPLLKELLIESSNFGKTLYIESLTLKSLGIRNTASKDDNVRSCISIKAPNLRYLDLQDPLSRFNIGDLNFLSEANLDLWDIDPGIERHARHLTEKVSGVTTLRLGATDVICFEGDIPTFENLTHLKIIADNFTHEILKSTPKLKSLIFETVESIDTHFFYRAVPDCISCLETVEFFLVKKRHINLVKYFLKAGTALKEMIINLQNMSLEHERAVYHSLLNSPRSSSICQFKVHVD